MGLSGRAGLANLSPQHPQRNVRMLRWLAVLIIPCLVLLALGSAWMLGRDGTVEVDPSNLTYQFIRIKYDGHGWDDGMDAVSRADINFLDYFHKLTGFKTATASEAIAISSLAKYPKGYAPPMVYMTGDGKIDVPDRDVQIMRDYLMGGGMLFADCGGPAWHGAFVDFVKRVFPGENLIRISDDDIIFQAPFPFESGAPPLWHHGGRDALGIKHKGRWAVFYHPGDLNDAWKDGRGGLTSKQAEGALEMGVNLVYYSYSNYQELNRDYRRARDWRADNKPLRLSRQLPAEPGSTRMPWTRYPLTSASVFDVASNSNRALEVVRKLIRAEDDLPAVIDALGSVPYSAYCVTTAQTPARTAVALRLDVLDGNTLLLVFENGEATVAHPLVDSLLLTVRGNRVSMLVDIIPRVSSPRPADFRRSLSWHSASFEAVDRPYLEALLKRTPPSEPQGRAIE